MRSHPSARSMRRLCATATLTLVGLVAPSGGAVTAQKTSRELGSKTDTLSKLEIYGFGQADMIVDARRTDPNWFDVNRPSRLPAFGTQFNANGNFYASARQSRFGATCLQFRHKRTHAFGISAKLDSVFINRRRKNRQGCLPAEAKLP